MKEDLRPCSKCRYCINVSHGDLSYYKGCEKIFIVCNGRKTYAHCSDINSFNNCSHFKPSIITRFANIFFFCFN